MRYTKQLITVSLLMGLSLNSCTNDDNSVPSQQTPTVILFSASPYRLESKAIHTESTMPTDLPIGIYGWGHKLGQTAPLTPRPDLTNQAYTTTDGTAYTSDMDAHFPVASDTVIDFYAYYPYQASLSNSEASYDLKDQIDIMYATPILNKGKMDVETDTNSSTATATVALTFNHQLSAITIVIKKADDIKEPLILQKSGVSKLPVIHPHDYPDRPVNRLEYGGGLSNSARRTDYHHSRRGYRIDKLPALARRGSHVPFLHQRPYLRGSSLPSIHRRQEAEIYLHHTSRRHQRRCLHQSLDRRPGRFW